MRKAGTWVVIFAAFLILARNVQAQQATANLQVVADVPAVMEASLRLSSNSRCTGNDVINFDVLDSEDIGVTDPNASFMYAPPRSQTQVNCQVLDIKSNSSGFTLMTSASGNSPAGPLADHLSVFFGGFFAAVSTGGDKGGKSGDWEPVRTFTRQLNEPFQGEAPFNWRLDCGNLPCKAGSYIGSVTVTVVSN